MNRSQLIQDSLNLLPKPPQNPQQQHQSLKWLNRRINLFQKNMSLKLPKQKKNRMPKMTDSQVILWLTALSMSMETL